MPKIFLSFWNGETSLGRAFWIWGVLGTFLLGTVGFANRATGLYKELDPAAVVLISGIIISVRTAYAIFTTVGIWRSASSHNGSRGIARLTQACVALWLICVLFTLTPLFRGLLK